MPHDCTVLKPMTGMFWPTLRVDKMQDLDYAHCQLDIDSTPNQRPHGFLVLFKEKVMSWDATIKDFIYRQDVPGVHDTL